MPRSVAEILPFTPPGGGGGGLTPTSIKIDDYIAAANEAVRTDTSGGGFTVTLPSSPADGVVVQLEDTAETWDPNPILLVTSDGATIDGFPGDAANGLLLDKDGEAPSFRYDLNDDDWRYLGQTGLLGVDSGGGGGGGANPGGVKFLLTNQDQNFDVSDTVNQGIWRTGSAWTTTRTVTFDGIPPDDAIFQFSNNSGQTILLANGINSPLDLTALPFALEAGEYIELATYNATNKLIKTLRAWETSSSRIVPFGGDEFEFLAKETSGDFDYGWRGINDVTEETVPVGTADYVLIWDTSVSRHRKVLLNNLPGGGGGVLATDIFVASDANVAITAPNARSGVLFNQTLTLTANRNVDIAISAGWNRMYTVWHQAAGGFTVTVRLENPSSPGNYVAALTAPLVVGEVALFVIRGDGFAEAIYHGPQVPGDFNGVAIVDYIQPHVGGFAGTLTQAAHGGRSVLATGLIEVPIASGFVCEIMNKSGTNCIVKPAIGSGGDLIHEGARKDEISLPNLRSVVVKGDSADVWVYGALN